MKARSVLMVPRNQRNKVEKSQTFGADVVILDLEDSVPVGPEKERARQLIREAAQWAWQSPVMVRLNSEPRELAQDFAFFGDHPPMPVCLSKAEPAKLAQAQVPIEAIIVETALGVAHAEKVTSFPGLSIVLVGLVDLAADLGVQESRDAHPFTYARSRILMAAKATGVSAVDGGYANFRDGEGFTAICQSSRAFGFDGIICVHPDQVRIANSVFRSTPSEIAWAEEVLEAWQSAESQGLGVAILKDAILDEVHVRMARKILDRN